MLKHIALTLLLAWQVQTVPYYTIEDYLYRNHPREVRCEKEALSAGFTCGILVQLDPPMPEGIASIAGGDYDIVRGIKLIIHGTLYTAVFDPPLKPDNNFPKRGDKGVPVKVAGDELLIRGPHGKETKAKIISRKPVQPNPPQPA